VPEPSSLLSIQQALGSGDFRAAYEAADRLNGSGEAFATKILHFMGWSGEPGGSGEKHLIVPAEARIRLQVHVLCPTRLVQEERAEEGHDSSRHLRERRVKP
jgi:hypothetical protein